MIFGRYTIGSVITLERSKTRDVFHQTSPNNARPHVHIKERGI